MSYLWPTFILGVAIGLYEFYLFDRSQPRGAFIAASILALVALIFYSLTALFTVGIYFIWVGLILVGIIIIFYNKKSW